MATSKVISSELLTKIETALGSAYATLLDAVGSQSAVGTALYNVTKAKLLVRGGHDLDYGVKTTGTPPTYSIEPLGVTGNFYVPTTTLYFGGIEKVLAGVTVAATGAVIATPPYNSCRYGVYVYALDCSTPDTETITVNVVPSTTSNLIMTALVSGDDVPSFSELFPANYKPSTVPTTAVLLAKLRCGREIPTTSDISLDETRLAFYEGSNTDEIVDVIFSGINDSEDALLATNFGSQYTQTLTTLESHVRTRSGVAFKDYWKQQNYRFTDNFRRLWSDAKNAELSTDFGVVYPHAGSGNTTYSGRLCYKPTAIEAALPDASSTGISMSAFLYNTASYSTVLKYRANVTEGTGPIYLKDAITSWPTMGYLAINGRCLETGFSAGSGHELMLVGSYDRSSSATIVTFQRLPHYVNNVFDPWRSEVLCVDKYDVAFTAGSPSGSVMAIGSTNYNGVAYATVSQGIGTLGVLLRSK